MSILAGQPQTSIEPMMLYMGRLAREAARTLALASTEQKNAALEAMARRIEARSGAILEANRNDIEAARGKGPRRSLHRPDGARRGAGEGDGQGLARHCSAAGSSRRSDRIVDAAERLGDLARARAARRDRHHL